MRSNEKIRYLYKPVIWVFCLVPIFWLGWLIVNKELTTNPSEFTNQYLGQWAIRMLWIALTVTPVALITGLKEVVRVRRLIGLFAFFYVFLHVTSYVAVVQVFDWFAIYNDIFKRVYITIGAAAMIILTMLAATSPSRMIKFLGSKTWKWIHQGAYIAAILSAIHFIMMRKGFQLEPLIYAGILVFLLATRAVYYLKKRFKTKLIT